MIKNRIIKFRAWYNGRMLYNIGTLEFFEPSGIVVNEECIRCQLMQFTGLKDRNNKEIYEGDIVKTDPNHFTLLLKADDCIEYTCGEIMWLNEAWKVGQSKIGASYMGNYAGCDCCPCGLEIIGNIYENPELIKI